jgi:hypothetical protein
VTFRVFFIIIFYINSSLGNSTVSELLKHLLYKLVKRAIQYFWYGTCDASDPESAFHSSSLATASSGHQPVKIIHCNLLCTCKYLILSQSTRILNYPAVNLRVGVLYTVYEAGILCKAPSPSPDKIPIRNAVLCEADSVRVRLRKRGTGVGGRGVGEGGTTVVQ